MTNLVCQILGTGKTMCLFLQTPFQEKIYLLVPLADVAACLSGKEVPDAAVASQLDGTLQWEHTYAGDVRRGWAEGRVEAQSCKWATCPLGKALSSCASPGCGAALPCTGILLLSPLLLPSPVFAHTDTHTLLCGWVMMREGLWGCLKSVQYSLQGV